MDSDTPFNIATVKFSDHITKNFEVFAAKDGFVYMKTAQGLPVTFHSLDNRAGAAVTHDFAGGKVSSRIKPRFISGVVPRAKPWPCTTPPR